MLRATSFRRGGGFFALPLQFNNLAFSFLRSLTDDIPGNVGGFLEGFIAQSEAHDLIERLNPGNDRD